MSRPYDLPEKLPGEDNWDWCQRAAASIPAEHLAAVFLAEIAKRHKKSRTVCELWSVVGEITGHGSGIAHAIVNRFMDED